MPTNEQRARFRAAFRTRAAAVRLKLSNRVKRYRAARRVMEAAREAVAVLEGNHHEGSFTDPRQVAADMLKGALIAHDAIPSDYPHATH